MFYVVSEPGENDWLQGASEDSDDDSEYHDGKILLIFATE